jgi:hypothetical protein
MHNKADSFGQGFRLDKIIGHAAGAPRAVVLLVACFFVVVFLLKFRFAPLREGGRTFVIVFALAQVLIVLAVYLEAFLPPLNFIEELVNLFGRMRRNEPAVAVDRRAPGHRTDLRQ